MLQDKLTERGRVRVAGKVATKAAVSVRWVGVRHLQVPMAVPTREKPVLMARGLALVAALEMGPVMGPAMDRAMDRAMRQAMVATAVGAGRAARAMHSARVGHQPMMPAQAKVALKCRGKDRLGGAAEPGLTVALKMTVGTVRGRMPSLTP